MKKNFFLLKYVIFLIFNEYNKEKRFKIDKWKKEQCDKHNIELIYFANKYEAPDEYIGKIFTNEKELLDYVKYLFINKK